MSDVEFVLRERTRELASRMKELNCLYRASDLLQRDTLDPEVKLRQMPGLLVSGLRFPEVARVLLEIDERRYEVEWGQPHGPVAREPVRVNGREVGALHVAYGPHGDGPDPSPDERTLVAAIATRIGVMLERQRAEAERLALEDQLRQSQKMEAIGRLAGGIAHDFNNLLTSIKGLSSLALRELSPDHPIRPDLEEIEKAAQRAAGLTRQLLAFSRKQMLKLVPVDLNDVVSGIERMLRRVITERIELHATYGRGLQPVMADPSQLEQVVMNLVVNAQDALGEGGTIEIATRHESIGEERGPVPPGEYAVLSVRDTGVGIAPDHLDKVFEPFFTTKPPGEGTGLGLATVFGIVNQGGGFLQVESRLGAGATFRVYLPFATETAHEEAEDSEPDTLAGFETVVVAEDDAAVRRLVNRILGRAGYRVLQAENARQALEVIEDAEGRVHLLLTDVVMPHGGGEELYDLVKARWPGVRVLYMSGYTDNPVVRREAEDPNGAYLAKPFAPDALLAKVRRVLDREPQTLADR
jgi:signal transduction histidine kinase/CheY-like chemotaxis protein